MSTHLNWLTGHDSATFHNRAGRTLEYLEISGKTEHDCATIHNRAGRTLEYLEIGGKTEHDCATIQAKTGRKEVYIGPSNTTKPYVVMPQGMTRRGLQSSRIANTPTQNRTPPWAPLTTKTKLNKPNINRHPPGFEPGTVKPLTQDTQPLPLSYQGSTKKGKLQQPSTGSAATQGSKITVKDKYQRKAI